MIPWAVTHWSKAEMFRNLKFGSRMLIGSGYEVMERLEVPSRDGNAQKS